MVSSGPSPRVCLYAVPDELSFYGVSNRFAHLLNIISDRIHLDFDTRTLFQSDYAQTLPWR